MIIPADEVILKMFAGMTYSEADELTDDAIARVNTDDLPEEEWDEIIDQLIAILERFGELIKLHETMNGDHLRFSEILEGAT